MGRAASPKARSGWRNRLLAVLLGFSPFVLLELILQLLGLPTTRPPADPFVDLHNLRPLFTLNADAGKLEISPERLQLFRPATFDLNKPSRTFRVFALGGSTTQGEPYSTETAFPAWLQLNLQAASGDQVAVEVVNCGGLSYASYRVLAILREVLTYDPDLIVVYTGHNEYLEQRTYAGYQTPTLVNRTLSRLFTLRTVQLARKLTGQTGELRSSEVQQRTELQTEVDALLDYQGGLADYHRGDAWFEPVAAHFRWNLEQMVESCRRADTPLLLVRPVSNLLDCPPMKFETDPKLAAAERETFEQHWELARDPALPSADARQHLQAALTIDPLHAGANYLQGLRQFDERDFDAALASFQQAKDNDVCPLRATTAITQTVTDVARAHRIPLLDAEVLFAARSEHGIVGNRWLVDHVHPNLDGHQLIGEELAGLCFEHALFARPTDGWEARRTELYASHLSTLSEAYFQRGKQRLEGLLLWTQGRAKKVRNRQ